MNTPHEQEHEAMSRVEELTLRLLDGELTAAEETELEKLVASDPEARRVHLDLLEQEAELRGLRKLPELRGPVLERLQKEVGARIEKSVMERIQQAPPSQGRRSLSPSAPRLHPSDIKPVEREMNWKRFRQFVGIAAALLLLVVGLRTLYVSNRTAATAEAFVYGQWNLAPGTPAAYRVLVRNGQTARPLDQAKVRVLLVNGQGRTLQSASGVTGADGSLNVQFELPGELAEGDYSLRIETDSSEGSAEVSQRVAVRRNFRVLVTADKPLYQPGQTIHIRTLALATADLTPAAGREAVIEVQDAKGNKVFRKRGVCSAYGIFSADFELADQVNTGDYTIAATVGESSSERSVSVKRYALPKFRVDLAAEKGFYQPGQVLKGDLSAQYTFGEPVSGAKVKVTLSEFIETFRPFANAEGTADASGKFNFSLPLKDHFVGTDFRKGDAQVWLEATVTDDAGHTQSKTIALTVTETPIRIEVIPESGTLVQNVENTVYLITAYPDGRPAKTSLTIGRDGKAVETSELGIAKVKLTPNKQELQLTIRAQDQAGLQSVVTRKLNVGAAEETLLLRADRAFYKTGETATVTVLSSRPTDRVFLDVIKDGRTELMTALDVTGGRGELALDLPPDLFGTLELRAYRILPDGNIAGDSRIIQVRRADDLKIAAELDKKSYQPAEKALLKLLVTRGTGDPAQAALSLAGVDEAVFALSEARPGLERVYFTIQEEILKPRYELCAHAPVTPAEVLQREEPPSPQLEEATVALFSAAEGKSAPKMEAGERFHVRQSRFEDEKQKHYDNLEGAVYCIPATLFFLSVLPLFIYAASKLRNRTPVTVSAPGGKQSVDELARSLWRMTLLWGLGLWLPLVAAFVTGLVFSNFLLYHSTVSGLALLAGTTAALLILGSMLVRVREIRRNPVSHGVPALRKLIALVPIAYGLVLLAIPMLAYASDNWHFGSFSRATAAWGLVAVVITISALCGVLSAGFRSVVETVSTRRWWWLALSRPAFMAVPAGLLAMVFLSVGSAHRPMGNLEMLTDSLAAKSVQPSAPLERSGFKMTSEGSEATTATALKAPTRIRSYFPETLLWIPELITDEKGHAQIEIPLADSITTWRLSMSAVSARGELGAGTLPLRVFQDFFVDIDFPAALTQHDTVSVPVAVYNYLDKPQTVRLEVQPGSWFELLGNATHTLTLSPRQVTSISIPFRAQKPGRHTMTVKAFGSEMADAVERSVLVEPDGQPFVSTVNGQLADHPETTFTIPDSAIDGASDLVVKVYPGAFSQVVEGLENIFRMPYGCFEQTSSTTYPNVLVLDYLRRTKRARPEIEMKALNFINLGYQRLLTFEVKGGGFEWFGRAPSSLVLTAYGLLEFSDMAKVYDVDRKVIERTREWLESKQQGNGSWKPDGLVMHEGQMTSAQDRELRTTAYIAWALAEAGGSDACLNRALEWLVAKAGGSDDPYTLALAANALVSAQRPEAKDFLKRLEGLKQEKDKLAWWSGKGESATYSRGDCLDAETTALAAQAFVKSNANIILAHKALAWLVAKKDPQGTWYSTQATVQAMRALLAGTGNGGGGAIEVDTDVAIMVNGAQVKTLKITRDTAEVFHLVSLREFVRPGQNTVTLEANSKANLACQVVATHYLPWAGEKAGRGEEPLSIEQRYNTTQLKKDDILSCQVTVLYNRREAANMTIVDLGLPPGFEVEAGCFQTLKDRGVIEQYSLTDRQAILYFRELPAGKPVSFEYRLRAKYPIKAKAPAATAYQYYEPVVRNSTQPTEITVF